ncbi:MAG: sugar transferase [Chloroflexota bacterium]
MFGKLRRLILILCAADALGTQLALLAADSLRRFLPLGRELGNLDSQLNIYIHLMVAVLFPIVFLVVSVYDVRRDVRPVGDARALFVAVSTATLALAGALYFSYRDVPRLLVFYFYFFDLLILTTVRLTMALILRVMHASGKPLTRILLVGAGAGADAVTLALNTRLGHSIQIIGCADDSATPDSKFLGRVDDVPRLARDHQVDEVIICLPAENYTQVERLTFALQTESVRVRLVPDFLKLVMVKSSVDLVGGIPLIGLREPRIDGSLWAVKRIFDLAVTLCGMIIALPLMGLIALAIKLTSAGPILFTQPRVGENGKIFGMYKFRTMVAGAENKVNQETFEKRPDDPRVTTLGRFLRRTSLDELPQIFNVLKGEMSLVGPRPEMTFIVDKYEPWQRQRLAVPPGITGWWQVSGRSDLPMHLNTQYDLYYIRNYSILLDLKILWRTAGVVIRGKGAY